MRSPAALLPLALLASLRPGGCFTLNTAGIVRVAAQPSVTLVGPRMSDDPRRINVKLPEPVTTFRQHSPSLAQHFSKLSKTFSTLPTISLTQPANVRNIFSTLSQTHSQHCQKAFPEFRQHSRTCDDVSTRCFKLSQHYPNSNKTCFPPRVVHHEYCPPLLCHRLSLTFVLSA